MDKNSLQESLDSGQDLNVLNKQMVFVPAALTDLVIK